MGVVVPATGRSVDDIARQASRSPALDMSRLHRLAALRAKVVEAAMARWHHDQESLDAEKSAALYAVECDACANLAAALKAGQ